MSKDKQRADIIRSLTDNDDPQKYKLTYEKGDFVEKPKEQKNEG